MSGDIFDERELYVISIEERKLEKTRPKAEFNLEELKELIERVKAMS